MTAERGGLRILGVAVALALALGGPAAAQAPAQAPEEQAVSLEEQVARDAAASLGWPTVVERKAVRESTVQEETLLLLWPPESAIRYANKPMYTATNGGGYEEETIQWLRVINLGERGARDFLYTMADNGLPRVGYQGRPGVVVRSGDKICDPGGLLGYVLERVNEAFDDFFDRHHGRACRRRSAR